MNEIRIPQLAESISEAVLAEWLKNDGDSVRMDEPIATLETDKAAVEIAADANGVLHHDRKAGDTVQVGDVIARIDPAAVPAAAGAKGEARGGRGPAEAGTRPKEAGDRKGQQPTNGPGPSGAKTADDAPLSPAVRRLVEQHGIDPGTVKGSGKGGRLLKEDVLRHMESQSAAPAQPAGRKADAPQPAATKAAPARPSPPAKASAPARPSMAAAASIQTASGDIVWEDAEFERAMPMNRIRQRIAERLVQAQQTAAILTTFNEVDMSAVMELRARYKESFEKRHGVRLGFMSFFARASVLALNEIPEVNAEVRGTDIVYKRHVHLGVAVGTGRGLIVPVLKQAERMGFADIEREIGRLAARGRDGTVSLDELSGGTFTISNGGVYGSLLSTPILNPPQSGILGMHKIEKRPIVLGDDIVVRPMMYLALSYDHRIVDGEQAVTFLVKLKERLEDPERMLLDV